MKFNILAERSAGDRQTFTYDNTTNTLTAEDGRVFEYPPDSRLACGPGCKGAECACATPKAVEVIEPFSPDKPLTKSRRVTRLKIQMGLQCNYSCTYCSQKFLNRPEDGNPKQIEQFLKLLDNLDPDPNAPFKVEFWGGEPLVYWKTMKPLAEALRARFDHHTVEPTFSIVTNGALLTREINDWLLLNNFSVSISHDGPNQHERGPDPFDDPVAADAIRNLYKRLKATNRIAFGSVLHRGNQSRAEVAKWFREKIGDPNVQIGEGGFIDAYDKDGLAASLQPEEHFAFRRRAFNEVISGEANNFSIVNMRIQQFRHDLLAHRPSAVTFGQKCGMDHSDQLVVDLRGNVITCQNTSPVDRAGNGVLHLAGNLRDMDAVRVRTATHWANREHCSDCPVLHLCKGSCMFLYGDNWAASCANSYSDLVVFFAAVLMEVTNGYVPIAINADHLPAERRDIWGTVAAADAVPLAAE